MTTTPTILSLSTALTDVCQQIAAERDPTMRIMKCATVTYLAEQITALLAKESALHYRRQLSMAYSESTPVTAPIADRSGQRLAVA